MASLADAAIADAITSIKASGVDLSPVSSLLIQGIEAVAAAIPQNLIDTADELTNTLSSAFDTIAPEIPVIGLMVKFWEIGANVNTPDPAVIAANCRADMTRVSAGSKGAGGKVYPTDLFNPTAPGAPGDSYTLPTLGSMLCRIFEADDDPPIVSEDPAYTYGVTYPLSADQRKEIRLFYNVSQGNLSIQSGVHGCPAGVRRAIKATRVAIMQTNGYGSDGGLSLFPPLLDLYLWCIDNGCIDYGYAVTVSNTKILATPGSVTTGTAAGPAAPEVCDWTPAVDMVWRLLDGWRNTLNPTFAPDIANLKAILAQSKEIGLKASQAAAGIATNPIHLFQNATKNITSLLGNASLAPAARASLEKKAEAAGLTPLQIVCSSPYGWSANLSPLLNWSVSACAMLNAFRAQRPVRPLRLTNVLPASTLSHLASLAGKLGS